MPSITAHSTLFFTLSLLLMGTLGSEPSYWETGTTFLNTLSFFLILTIGICHGSLDHIKGKKLLKILGFKSLAVFYIGYIFVGLTSIIIWLFFPKLLLFLFLLIAAFHFGKEDSEFINKKKNFELIYFLKGSLIIVAPLLFHKKETISIFKSLNFDISISFLITNEILYLFILLSFISNIFLSLNKSFDSKSLLFMDFLSILILNYFLNPV